jgi:hypothetical protein
MSKTYKDVKDFDVKRHKEIARKFTKDLDMRTRTKPLEKKEKGGGKNSTKDIIGIYVDEIENEWEDEQYDLDH